MAQIYKRYSSSINVGESQRSVLYRTDGTNTKPYFLTKVSDSPYSVPFYIEDISGTDNTLIVKKNGYNALTLNVEKSLDGVNWEDMGQTTASGITATIPANGRVYLRCNTNVWGQTSFYNMISATNSHIFGGNIMSVLYGDNFTGSETSFPSTDSYVFFHLFDGDTTLVSAEDLLLPAMTLTGICYGALFKDCTSLTTAPALPATQLDISCYANMFDGCTALTYAPELPAETLSMFCYQEIFNGCTALNNIVCHATDISAYNSTVRWVTGVSEVGTLHTPASTPWTTGENGIPEGWTRIDT